LKIQRNELSNYIAELLSQLEFTFAEVQPVWKKDERANSRRRTRFSRKAARIPLARMADHLIRSAKSGRPASENQFSSAGGVCKSNLGKSLGGATTTSIRVHWRKSCFAFASLPSSTALHVAVSLIAANGVA
jgi:hypothetical protein